VDEGGRRIDTRRCHGSADSVNLWQATNAKARDFRLDVIGAA
jgi:PhoPQ-activated pathogenicity-related protein